MPLYARCRRVKSPGIGRRNGCSAPALSAPKVHPVCCTFWCFRFEGSEAEGEPSVNLLVWPEGPVNVSAGPEGPACEPERLPASGFAHLRHSGAVKRDNQRPRNGATATCAQSRKLTILRGETGLECWLNFVAGRKMRSGKRLHPDRSMDSELLRRDQNRLPVTKVDFIHGP